MPWPHSLHVTAWCEVRAKIWSSYAKRDQGTWGMIQAEQQRPLSACTGWHHKNKQWLNTGSQADRPCVGLLSDPFPCKRAPAPPPPLCSLAPDLGKTGTGRSLPQRQPRSQVEAQPPQFLQSQHSDPKPQPTLDHICALELGRTQLRKGRDLGLLLRGATDANTGDA